MAIFSHFPTQIYFETLQKNAASQRRLHTQLLREIDEVRIMDKAGIAWSKENYANGFTSYGSANDLQKRTPTFAELEHLIDSHVAKFTKHLDYDLGGKKLSMTTCWVNVMGKDTHHGMHIHPLAVISGTYYVTIPRGGSSIKFEDPRLSKMMNTPARKARAADRNQLFVEYAPTPGKLVLFESWLRHEVPISRVNGERISISFNYA